VINNRRQKFLLVNRKRWKTEGGKPRKTIGEHLSTRLYHNLKGIMSWHDVYRL
jgi:hypothetical protein